MPIKKKKGFTVEISSEIADILGVQKPDDLYMIIKGDELILKLKKDVSAHVKQQQENNELTKRLIKQYAPVLKKLAKT